MKPPEQPRQRLPEARPAPAPTPSEPAPRDDGHPAPPDHRPRQQQRPALPDHRPALPARPDDAAETSEVAAAGATRTQAPGGPLGDLVADPAVRAELARRFTELAELVDEAGDLLGGILDEIRHGRDGGRPDGV